MNLRSIARAVEGDVVGGHVLCPGPGHSPRDRSLAVYVDPNAPDLFRVHSFAGDNWRVCRDYVKARLGVTNVTSSGGCGNFHTRKQGLDASTPTAERTRLALAIWSEAHEINGTPGLEYLVGRGVDRQNLPPEIGGALRWHSACPWEGSKRGAIVTLLTDAVTGQPHAIHRTAIDPTGKKIGRKMLGPAAGCVVRFWPDEAVTTGLVLGEGLETTLVAATRIEHKGTRLAPAWAACSAGTMARFPVLPGIEALTLLVDNDENGVGQKAATECSSRWTAAGREVIRLVPDAAGADFADMAVAA